MSSARLACVSVDLDSLHHYCRIHGLDESLLDERARGLLYRVAVPRFLELFDELKLPATLFAVGEDLRGSAEAIDALKRASRQAIEIGNHSLHHDYALTRRTAAEMDAEVAGAESLIREASGRAPVGFRAPGYTLNAALYQVLERRGYLYDSSVFPAAPYWAAKAAVMGALWLARKPSRALLDSPRVLLAPVTPYTPAPEQPYSRGAGAVLELPMAVSPFLRFPFIGTFAATFAPAAMKAVFRSLTSRPFFNFELHGVDLLEASDGVPPELVSRQRDLAVPVALKRERLRAFFRELQARYTLDTLEGAAQKLKAAHCD